MHDSPNHTRRPMHPMPPSCFSSSARRNRIKKRPTPHKHAQTPRRIQPRPAIPIPTETRPERQQRRDGADEDRRCRRGDDAALAGVEPDAEGEEEERQGGEEFEGEGAVGLN